MKIAIWSYTAAIAFVALAVSFLSRLVIPDILHDKLRGKPLPPITEFLIHHPGWVLLVPLPWFLTASWLNLRKGALTPNRCFAFAGVSTFALAFLLAYTAIAFLLPFVRIIE